MPACLMASRPLDVGDVCRAQGKGEEPGEGPPRIGAIELTARGRPVASPGAPPAGGRNSANCSRTRGRATLCTSRRCPACAAPGTSSTCSTSCTRAASPRADPRRRRRTPARTDLRRAAGRRGEGQPGRAPPRRRPCRGRRCTGVCAWGPRRILDVVLVRRPDLVAETSGDRAVDRGGVSRGGRVSDPRRSHTPPPGGRPGCRRAGGRGRMTGRPSRTGGLRPAHRGIWSWPLRRSPCPCGALCPCLGGSPLRGGCRSGVRPGTGRP
ncbi:hypothetical protein EES41_01405 [Streptomyces sp. ADI95-16]|nr:hypothetical protein EES41_01405 [Streptomyces sp. ADI95-16]